MDSSISSAKIDRLQVRNVYIMILTTLGSQVQLLEDNTYDDLCQITLVFEVV